MADPGRLPGTREETVERINDARPKCEGEQPLIKRWTSGVRTKDIASVEGGRAGYVDGEIEIERAAVGERGGGVLNAAWTYIPKPGIWNLESGTWYRLIYIINSIRIPT